MILTVNSIYNENNLKTLARMLDNSVDFIITSPPYDDIREVLCIENNKIIKKYEIINALRTYEGYDWDIVKLSQELYRVCKPGGVCVWIMNDPTINGSESLMSSYTRIIFREAGWCIKDTMIEKKHNFSHPSRTTYHQIFEYMFVFSKGSKCKTFNPIKDRKNKNAGNIGSYGKNTYRLKNGEMKERERKIVNEYGMRYNIWDVITTGATKDGIQHPASFPEELVHDHMITWTEEGDVVYDPFGGSGTTGKVAVDLNRKFILSEISDKYSEISKTRIKGNTNHEIEIFK